MPEELQQLLVPNKIPPVPAGAAGAVLALTFFLTVSWNTTPYYYGADIVFLFAWTPFITMGAGGGCSPRTRGWPHAPTHTHGEAYRWTGPSRAGLS